MSGFDLNFESGDYSDDSSYDSSSNDNGFSMDWGLEFESGITGDSEAQGDLSYQSESDFAWDNVWNFDNSNQEPSTSDGFYDSGMDFLNSGLSIYERYQKAQNNNNWQNGNPTYAYPEQQANPQAQTFDQSQLPPPKPQQQQQQGFKMPSTGLMLAAGVALVTALVS
ncbi:MAG: hypothetical protein QM500_07095 [Methylococcales bacterium]